MSSSSYNPNITLTSLSTQQGEINLVTNPIAENDVSSWTTSSATLTRSTTGVLSPVIPTGFTASSTTSTTSYVQTSLLTVPATLRNRKLKVQLYIQCADTATWKVDVLKSDGSTRYTLSTDSSAVSALPALTGTYTTTFDMDTGSGIYVRLTRYAGSGTSTLSFTNLIVGPGIQPQGFAGQEWLSYTPTVSNLGTGTTSTNVAYFRRLGSGIEVKFTFTKDASAGTGATTVTVSLPSNLNIDFTKISTDEQSYAGTYDFRNGSAPNTNNPGSIKVTSGSTNTFYFQKSGATVAALTGADFPGTARIEGFVTLPIAEWAGSGTVQLAQNDVEFASNSKSDNTITDTTSFAYGPSGSLIPNGAVGTTYARAVKFQSAIQASDLFVVQVDQGAGQWVDIDKRLSAYTVQGTVWYGVQFEVTDATTVTVYFNAGGFRATGATYASNGSAWSSISTWRWRLRKMSAGAAVGFGIVQPGVSSGLVSASGLPGNTTGNAIATGYVGEQRRVTYSSVTIAGTATQLAVISNVTPGTYLVRFAGDSGVGTTTRIIYSLNTTVALDNTQSGETFWDAASTPSGANALVCQGMRYLSVTTTISNYYLVAVASTASSTSARGIFEIIRIA